MPTSSTRAPPAWIAPAILVATAAYLHSRWDELPQRWVVHWGAAGNPNGWTDKSFEGVYFPLVFGLGLWVFFEVVTALVRVVAQTRGQGEAASIATLPFMRWVSIGLAVMFAYLAIDLPLGHPEFPHTLKVLLLPLAGGILVGIIHSSVAFSRAQNEGTIDLPPGYHGVYYANAEDNRLFVPKISGLGLTLNFSHPLAWPVLFLLLGFPIALAVVVIRLTR